MASRHDAGVLHRLLAKEQVLRQQLPAKLHQLRVQRQWGALRAERCLTQLLLALIRIQIQLLHTHAHPDAAPSTGKADPRAHANRVALLEIQQNSLRQRCLAAAKLRDEEVRGAAALRKRPERRRQLAEVLRRSVALYEIGSTKLHAPIEDDQAAFERVACSPHAREARLVWRWLSLFQERARSSAAPSAAAVVDFCGYVGKLITAEYSFAAWTLPALQLHVSRLLLPMLQCATTMETAAAARALED